ncbi:putative U4/U6 small nuclear ribonuclear protein [Trypanosoma rangeli]|uniref:Putative U4/U6 small nuclear ribonuclear protein n=1 Tax=Trypanosoma rangeli TaxID=5698 RepID=A0A422NAK4_TRYRA|nr:putative U4/U6 small nuclear ribonuclear protein [Trypanosoma rangeli]RNF02462.1 putative U4/U6 small nuclear ribonuclear protein [Trypanosoma rangeli]|eukprot:RNF02462.1 putative U4/U6 small nuclear ribonuclear protein [Trypanosoma rangeli]
MELIDPVIPVTDHEVQQGLRLLEAPIVLFAEAAFERRHRLRKLMIEGGYRTLEDIRSKHFMASASSLSASQGGRRSQQRASAPSALVRNNETFSLAPPTLVERRQALLPLSMARAERRIASLKDAFVAASAVVRPAHQAAVQPLQRMRLTKSVRNVKMGCMHGTNGASASSSSLVGGLCMPFTSCAAVSMLPHTVVTGAADGVITLWNTDACLPLVSVSSCGSGWGHVRHLAVHPTTPFVFSTNMFDYYIAVWRITEDSFNDGGVDVSNKTGIDVHDVKHSAQVGLERVATSEEQHMARIQRLAVDPTGSLLASTSDDSTVCLWDAAIVAPHGKLPYLLTQDGYETAGGTLDVCFHPDGSLLSTTDKAGRVVTWDVRSGTHAFTTAGKHGGHLNACTCVSWSPCGVRFASGGADNLVHLWDARYLSRGAAEAPCILVGHEDVVTSVSFYANPAFPVLPAAVASTSLDGTVRLWDADAAGACVQVLRGPFPVRAQCRPSGGSGNALLTVAHGKYWSMWDVVAEGAEVEVIPKETEATSSVVPALLRRGGVERAEAEEEEEEDEMMALRRGGIIAAKSPGASLLSDETDEDEDEMSFLKKK